MLKIHFNNQALQLAEPLCLTAFLNQQGYQQKTFAVAVNKMFVPKTQYDQTMVQEGDHIDVVTPMQGG